MKKIISVLVSAVLAITSIMSIGFSAYAATDFSKAVNINVNTPISGNITNGSNYEQDIYRVTIKDNGVFIINMKTPLQADAKSYWRVLLYNGEYEKITELAVYGNKASTDAVSTGVAAGTYYVIVQSAEAYSVKSTDTYNLSVNYEKTNYWEKELNENFSTATEIALNSDYYGSTDDAGNYEKDYYTFSLPSAEAVTINFNVPLQANSKTYWYIYLYNSEYKEIMAYDVQGNKSQNELPTVGLPAGRYYLRIHSAGAYSVMSTDVYTLRLAAQVSDVWEKELNEDFASATSINLNTPYYGTTHASGNKEKDFFKFTVSKANSYIVNFKTSNLNNSEAYWKVYLYDGLYKEIASLDIKGNTTSNNIVKYLSAGTYYVKVVSANSYNLKSSSKYTLTVNELIVKNNPLTAKGKTVKLKYSKLKKNKQTIARKKAIAVSNAKGTVTYKKVKGNKKITINKTSGKITVKKGLKKGTYKVKVKVKAAGNTYYKAGSKTVTVTIKVKK
ncbi:MAG: cadherin repeat domain-containing protein [Eubacterium sp.]|nr:cadherin repeat domain-containing protein [Eubacterium sp.]